MAKNQKTGEGTPIERAVKFALTMTATSLPVAVEYFQDEKHWGKKRRFLELCDQVNDAWAAVRGTPLFEYLGPEQEQNSKVKKFFRRVDSDNIMVLAQNVAAIPALLQFTRTLKGTPLNQAMQAIYDNLEQKVAKSAKKPLRRIDAKYHLVTKGVKDYTGHDDVMQELNKALYHEKVLRVTRTNSKGKLKTEDLGPLSLLMFSGGLYLLAHPLPRQAGMKPNIYKVENFSDAKSTTASFDYPAEFSPGEHFKDTFGLFNTGDTLKTVEIEVLDDKIREYITQRTWTQHQKFDEKTGIFTMRIRDTTEVPSWVLGFGPKVKLLKPDWLREKVEAMITSTAKLYRTK